MIREYYNFIKEYLKLAELKKSYLIINIISAFLYKVTSILLPFIASLIIKNLTIHNKIMSYKFLVLYFFTYILYNLFLIINYRVYDYNMTYCYKNLTRKILNKLINVDNNFTRIISKGRFMNSINSDLVNIGDMNDRIAEVTMGIIQVLVVLIIICKFNIYIGLLFVLFSYLYLEIRNYLDRRVNYYHNKVQIEDDKYSTLLTQIMSGLQEIKTFNMIDKLRSNLNKIHKKFTKLYSSKRKYLTNRNNDVKYLIYIFRFILYILLIILILNNKIDISEFILIITYLEYLVTYLDDFIDSTCQIRETSIAVNRINDILNYNSNEIVFGALDVNDIYGSIEFKNVSLKIKNQSILNNINLKIKHNEVLAIVGEPGSGKTMLINLILRLYKPTKGKILIDNNDIFSFSKKVYKTNVAVVNQKPFIFNMSIRKNLDFVDKDINHQIEACKKAKIHDFIESLPDGYNTILREDANNISGGQKQMISIARTLLTNAEIILFDDITKSLDPDTSKMVSDILQSLRKNHTIIMVTKKPNLMKEADRIVVLDKGKIENVGTHKKLMKESKIYRNLQSRKSPSRLGGVQND